MTVVPRFPRLVADPPRSEALWNAAISHAGLPIQLVTGGATATFALAQAPDGSVPCLVIESDAGPTLYIYVSSFPFGAMFGADLSAEELLLLPPALRDAIAEGMASLIWNEIPERALGAFSLKAIGRLDQLAGDDKGFRLAWFRLALNGLAAEPIALSLGCARVELLEWLDKNAIAARRVHQSLKSQLQVTAAFTLNSASFTLRELRALSEGALVLLPAIEEQICAVRVGDTLYQFRSEGPGWAFLGSSDAARARERWNAERGDGSMNETADLAQGAAKFSDLQVVVDFDLGARQIALSEIETWQAGAVVSLDAPARSEGVEVTLRVNGKAVGIGELVRIDDRYAIRLSRLLFAP